MIAPRFLNVLRYISTNLDDAQVDWVVAGSLGFALHGLEVEVHDIDLQTDRSGSYEIERRFSHHLVQKIVFSSTATIRSYFGKLRIDGVKVEIMVDLQKRLPDGSWEIPVDVRKYRRFVEIDGLSVPVLSLEYECEAYRKLGRTEASELLRRWLEQKSNDVQ